MTWCVSNGWASTYLPFPPLCMRGSPSGLALPVVPPAEALRAGPVALPTDPSGAAAELRLFSCINAALCSESLLACPHRHDIGNATSMPWQACCSAKTLLHVFSSCNSHQMPAWDAASAGGAFLLTTTQSAGML